MEKIDSRWLSHRVSIILVEPRNPRNVGAVIRAMKNTGLEDLRVVNPLGFDPQQARWMAPGCHDMVSAIKFYGSIDAALDGVTRVVSTTARHRRGRHRVITPTQLADEISTDSSEGTTAILFGREDFGLDKNAVDMSEAILRIPTPEHASLNLGQAVLLVSHAIYVSALEHGLPSSGRLVGGRNGTRTTQALSTQKPGERKADYIHSEPAVEQLISLLTRVGYTKGTPPDKIAATARAIIQRSSASIQQVEALRGMINKINGALDNPERLEN